MTRTRITGTMVPLPIANLDTDQIMPKQFLRRIDKQGLAQGLLHDLRFHADGTARNDCVLNWPAYADPVAIIGGANFGCGSSREHAVWGLLQFGVRVVVAPSFGEIFYNNAMNNRLLLITLPPDDVARLSGDALRIMTNHITVDLARMTVGSTRHTAPFSLTARHRSMFLDGLDMIGATLRHQAAIAQFQAGHWERSPWLANIPVAGAGRGAAGA